MKRTFELKNSDDMGMIDYNLQQFQQEVDRSLVNKLNRIERRALEAGDLETVEVLRHLHESVDSLMNGNDKLLTIDSIRSEIERKGYMLRMEHDVGYPNMNISNGEDGSYKAVVSLDGLRLELYKKMYEE